MLPIAFLTIMLFGGVRGVYIHLAVFNSTDTCSKSNEIASLSIVDYYIEECYCVSSLSFSGGSEKYCLDSLPGNSTNVTVYKYSTASTSGCKDSDLKKVLTFHMGDCFTDFEQTMTTRDNSTYNFTETYSLNISYHLPNDTDIATAGNYTSISYFSDYECQENLPYSVYPRDLHFKREYKDRSYLHNLEWYCTNTSYFIYFYSVPFNDHFEYVKIFRDFPDETCTDRMAHSLLRRETRFQSFKKKCYFSTSDFEQEHMNPALTMCEADTTPKYQLQELYYTLGCEHSKFFIINKPQKICNQIGKIYCNNGTYRVALRWAGMDCTGPLLEIRTGTEEIACRPFSEAEYYVDQPTWGYKIRLTENVHYPNYLAFTVVPDCALTKDVEYVEKIKRAKGPEFYYFVEDKCVRESDWSGAVVTAGAVSIRGRCENGKIKAKNYTFLETCENTFIDVNEDFCAPNINGWGLYWTCIPYYCGGISQYDDSVCGGHGECDGDNHCSCEDDYDGSSCSNSLSTGPGVVVRNEFNPAWLTFILLPVFGIIGIISFCCCLSIVWVCCFCCCFGICFDTFRRWREKKPVAPLEPRLTFVFTDIKESTTMWNTHPNEMKNALHIHDKLIRKEIVRNNGFEVKTVGDSFFITFKNPVDALKFSCVLQAKFMKAHWPKKILKSEFCKPIYDMTNRNEGNRQLLFKGLSLRIGIHTGKQFTRKRNRKYSTYDYLGISVNKTARIETQGHSGFIFCSKNFYMRVRDYIKSNKESYVYRKLRKQKLKGFIGLHRLYWILPREYAKREHVMDGSFYDNRSRMESSDRFNLKESFSSSSEEEEKEETDLEVMEEIEEEDEEKLDGSETSTSIETEDDDEEEEIVQTDVLEEKEEKKESSSGSSSSGTDNEDESEDPYVKK